MAALYNPRPWDNTSNANSTTPTDEIYHENLTFIVTWFIALSCFATVVGNALLLLIYFRDPALRTTFNTYVVSLAATEIFLGLTAMPASVISVYYGYWPLSKGLCDITACIGQIFGSAVRYGHLLISANRLWAVTFPLSYNRWQTLRFSVYAVVGQWVFLCLLHLPVVIPGRIWLVPEQKQCLINKSFQFTMAVIAEFLGYDLPTIFIVFSYPFVSFKLQKRNAMKKRSRVVPLKSSQSMHIAREQTFSDNQATIAPSKPLPTVTPLHGGNAHYRILGYLVVAVIVCWTPNLVFFHMVGFQGYWNDLFFAVQQCLSNANSWLNPLLCFLALEYFRRGLAKLRPSLCDLIDWRRCKNQITFQNYGF